MLSHRRTHSTAADELDYLEKRGLDASHLVPTTPTQTTLEPAYIYHSRISGDGVFGISAYGLIILGALLVIALLPYGILQLFSSLSAIVSHSGNTVTGK